MSSPTSPIHRCRSGSISAQDLQQLLRDTGKSGFLRLRSPGRLVRKEQWKHRFVVLAHHEIYTYDSEVAMKATQCIPLLGYHKIMRFGSKKYPICFSLVPAMSSMKQQIFSCPTEAERIAWMRKIKDHMYTANNVEKPLTDGLNQLASGTEEEYLDMEEIIFAPEKPLSQEENPDFSDPSDPESIDGEYESDGDDLGRSKKSCRKLSTSSGTSERNLPPIPTGSNSNVHPPRYSQVVDSISKKHTYQNEAADKKNPSSLESCFIEDAELTQDREACIDMLKKTERVGTFLIRKSRQRGGLVLAVLTHNTVVKEYRLEEKNKLYRLLSKEQTDYISLESLIAHYSHTALLPNMKHFLFCGIFESPGDETYNYIQD